MAMETVPFNSVTAGHTQIWSAANNSALHNVFRIGAERAFSGKRVIVPTAIDLTIWGGLAADATRIAKLNALDNITNTSIRNFPGEPYALRRPITIEIEQIAEDDYLASFEEANIASSGTTFQEAYQNLAIEILNIFEKFTAEHKNLGPEPNRQLKILRRYLVRRR